jgi:hypothetical protein
MILKKTAEVVRYIHSMVKLASNNIIHTVKFFKKKQCKVIFFKVPSSVMYSYIDYDMISYVSNEIDKAQSLIEELENTDQSTNDPLLHNHPLRILIKLSYLINELRHKEMYNPVQLIKSGETKYLCHPGICRITVATYIEPTEFISGFYLWYPAVDDNPFILDYEYWEVTNPFAFLFNFKFNKSLHIEHRRITNNLDVSTDDTTLSGFFTAKRCFDKTIDVYDYQFLTFHDAVHWDAIINSGISLKDIITFKNATACDLSGIKFKKINNIWIAS